MGLVGSTHPTNLLPGEVLAPMPRPDSEQPMVPSLLDRLIDLEPRISTEPEASRSRSLVQIKEAVKRDLEWLLNSKRPAGVLTGLPHLDDSVWSYGLPDLSASSLVGAVDRERLRLAIEAAIRRFEPRLQGVEVTPLEARASDRSIRFRIEAMLRVHPAPEPVMFDSTLQLATKAFHLRGHGE
jgi:type VI secretion system protein ImpF